MNYWGFLKNEINKSERRDYYIEKVNSPLRKAAIMLANRYPEPTMENLSHLNSRKMLTIRNKYFEYEGNPYVKELLGAVFRVLIAKIEHSPNYRDRFSWLVEELIISDWKPRSFGHPNQLWNEPRPYGGGNGQH